MDMDHNGHAAGMYGEISRKRLISHCDSKNVSANARGVCPFTASPRLQCFLRPYGGTGRVRPECEVLWLYLGNLSVGNPGDMSPRYSEIGTSMCD